MNIVDVMSFVEKHLAEYTGVFVRTLVHPIARFQPLQTNSINNMPGKTQDLPATGGTGSRLQLAAFVLISIFLGSIINSFVPARKYSNDIVGKIVVLSFFWIFLVAYMHPLCRIFRGKADLMQTLWVSLQVFAPLFLVSSLINLVGGVFVMHPRVASFLVSTGRLGNSIAHNPVYIYFLVHYAFLNVYLPLALKAIHGFGWISTIMIAIALSLFWMLFGMVFSLHY